MPIIELKNIYKSYGKIDKRLNVLENVDFRVEKGEMVAITGKSGAGKTTLLNIMAALDFPDAGAYYFDGNKININIKNTSYGIKFRKNKIGLVFQHFALINDLSVYDNVELALLETSMTTFQRKKRVNEILSALGIESMKKSYPWSLSGGEKQLVAIARAIVNNNKVLLADEPTGSLDTDNENNILQILQGLNRKGLTIVLVTHDLSVANICDRVFVLDKH